MKLWIFAALIAYFIKGLCGFANTLIFTSILSFGSSNINISPVELLLGYPTNLIITFRERRNIRWSVCLPVALLVLMGNIPGIFLLKNINSDHLKILLGFVIILVSIEMLMGTKDKRKTSHLPASGFLLIIFGILTGIICGMFGIGALLAAYMNRITEDTGSFKANLCFIFIAENTFRILLYIISGIITISVLKQAVLLIPVMLAGLFLGMKCSSILNEKMIRKAVTLLLIFSGVMLIISVI